MNLRRREARADGFIDNSKKLEKVTEVLRQLERLEGERPRSKRQMRSVGSVSLHSS